MSVFLLAMLIQLLDFHSAEALVPQRYLAVPTPAGFTISSFSKVINSGRFEGADLGQLYWERGVQFGDLGQYDKAITDYSRALDIRPGHLAVRINRAVAYARLEQYDAAYADLAQAIKQDPGYASLYKTRGTLSFLLGRYPDAIRDFKHYLSLKPDDRYRMIWLYLSERYLNPKAAGDLSKYVAGINLDVWPGAILRLFLGQVEVKNVLQSLSKNLSNWSPGDRCEVYFYLGQYYLLEGEKAKALKFFREAVKTGATGYTEYEFSLVYSQKLAK